MITQELLQEVVTLPEASTLAGAMGYGMDRSNLLRYARTGRLVARKSGGTWLTTRSAVQALIVDLASEARGRPRAQPTAWTEVAMTPELVQTLQEIDTMRLDLAQQPRGQADQDQHRRELIVDAIYHTNRIEGNQLSLHEVKLIVESFWAENAASEGNQQHEQPATG